MSGNGGKTTTTTVQNQDPWEGQQQYLTTGFQAAQQDVLNRPTSYYPESTVVPFSPQTETAMGAMEQRALQGNPLNFGAQQYTGNVLGGQYLGAGNPYHQAMVERSVAPMREEFQEVVQPGISGMFSKAGRYGSPGGHQAAMQRASNAYMDRVGNLSGALAYQNYADERSRQQQAASMAPDLAATDYYDIAQLGQVGAAREAMEREKLAEDVARFEFGQREPIDRVAQYMGLIGGGYGGQTQSSQVQSGGNRFNPILGGLGAASSLAGIGSGMFGQQGIWPGGWWG